MKKTLIIVAITVIIGFAMMIGNIATEKTYAGLVLYYIGWALFMLEVTGLGQKIEKKIKEFKEQTSDIVVW